MGSIARNTFVRYACNAARPAPNTGKHRCRHTSKELASIPEMSWRAGQQDPLSSLEPGKCSGGKDHWRVPAENSCGPTVRAGPLYGNSYAVYSTKERGPFDMPRFVLRGSEMHTALTEMKLSRSGIAFNPWTLLLELLDDPRLTYNAGSANKMLVAIGHLGWTSPGNLSQQRPLMARYLLRAGCFSVREQFSSELPDGVIPELEAAGLGGADLTSAQLMQLCQMQWPRFIAQKYEHCTPSALASDTNKHDDHLMWRRRWLSANLAILGLRAAYIKRRVLFNSRMDKCAQSRYLIRYTIEHSPGLALNTLLGWGGDYSKLLNPFYSKWLCSAYFGNHSAAKDAVLQAWQMYSHLIHHNPHMNPPTHFSSSTGGTIRPKSQAAASSPSAILFRALSAFDNWEEATRSLGDLYLLHEDASAQLSPEMAELDNKLVRCFVDIERMRSPKRRPPSPAGAGKPSASTHID